MRGFIIGFSISFAFILGCVISQIVIPAATAHPAPRAWEYRCLVSNLPNNIQAKANELGADGWELVTAAGHGTLRPDWCFKRPLL